eukprot:gnl/TRDRNA2_/TRDRNA2_96705_c0_seq1.p1 gnl/TRDRNA2_/TRDRNA2_96705_c0~~gnl/TRDRNA2_/TRDRNA2_96705_c0_seq1.p1  ORF type:complete len:365 (-),score=43.39 gnl/TRDRNA2_/TRDRNA2_96705_c0_seq1:63-1091(-)
MACEAESTPTPPARSCKSCADCGRPSMKNGMAPASSESNSEYRGRNIAKLPQQRSPFEHLKLTGVIGRGSFGTVFTSVLGASKVAVKVMKYQASKEEDAMKVRFEIGLSVRLNHPNIVRTFQYAARGDPNMVGYVEAWIVSELCDLGNLSSQIAAGLFHQSEIKGQPNLPLVAHALVCISAGLEYIHNLNLVHADLSSNNVLLCSSDGRNTIDFDAKIADFGMARIIEGCGEVVTKSLGTAAYMAPELFAALEVKLRTTADIYSVGVLMFHLCSGKEPWVGLLPQQIPIAILLHKQQLELESTSCPEDYNHLFRRCIASEECQRPTACELVVNFAELSLKYS